MSRDCLEKGDTELAISKNILDADNLIIRHHEGGTLCPACIARIHDAVMDIVFRFKNYLEENQF